MPPHNITHIITGLDLGGAETMLVRLLGVTDRARWRPAVISLRDQGALGEQIAALGVPVVALGMRRVMDVPTAIWRLRSELRRLNAGLLQGWMYHGNLAALVGRVFSRARVPLLWNIRYTPDDLGRERAGTAAAIRWGARLSSHADRIIYNSRAGAARHAQLGYASDRSVVVHNGFDTDRFAPSPAHRAEWRKRIGVTPETVVIGRVGRYHPMKDHATFLSAGARLVREGAPVRLVLAGPGVDDANHELANAIGELGLRGVVSLLGPVQAIEQLTPAFDIACSSSSYGEAFPNALGEAMACGVPCVTTDVGDAAVIVGSTGLVVPSRDPMALANALQAMINCGEAQRRILGAAARARIVNEFSLPRALATYEKMYRDSLAEYRRSR